MSDSDWETPAKGRSIKRSEGGLIEKATLDPEVAREMSNASRRRRSKEFKERVILILKDYGFDGVIHIAPEYAYDLAGLVAEGKAGCVPAHKALSDISPNKAGQVELAKAVPGQDCPSCGHLVPDKTDKIKTIFRRIDAALEALDRAAHVAGYAEIRMVAVDASGVVLHSEVLAGPKAG